MSNGKIVWESCGQRYLALPRDHRGGYKCFCCAFGFSPKPRSRCPKDKDNNLLCNFGHGFTFKRLAIVAKPNHEPRAASTEMLLVD